MFDTNALNRLVDRGLGASDLPRGDQFFVTASQIAELTKTREPTRREALLSGMRELEPALTRARLRTGPYGIAPYGESPYGGGEDLHYSQALGALRRIGGKSSHRGDPTDALILEVCLAEGHTLVTDDEALAAVSRGLGAHTQSVETFLGECRTNST
jgi:predicted nucleic acid-binding protein